MQYSTIHFVCTPLPHPLPSNACAQAARGVGSINFRTVGFGGAFSNWPSGVLRVRSDTWGLRCMAGASSGALVDGPSPCWQVHHRGRWSTAPLLVGGCIIGGAGRRPLSLLVGSSSGALVDGPSPCWRVHHRGRWSTALLLVGGCIIGDGPSPCWRVHHRGH